MKRIKCDICKQKYAPTDMYRARCCSAGNMVHICKRCYKKAKEQASAKRKRQKANRIKK